MDHNIMNKNQRKFEKELVAFKQLIEDNKKEINNLKEKIKELELKLSNKELKSVECQTDINTPLTQQQGTFLSGKTIQSLTVSECSGIIIDHPNGSSTIVPQFYSRSTMPQPGPFLQFPLIPSTTAMMQSSSSSSFTRTKYSSKVVASHSSKAMTSRSSKVIAHHSSKAVSRSRAAQGHCSRAKHVASSSYSQTYTSVMRKIISKNNTKKHK